MKKLKGVLETIGLVCVCVFGYSNILYFIDTHKVISLILGLGAILWTMYVIGPEDEDDAEETEEDPQRDYTYDDEV